MWEAAEAANHFSSTTWSASPTSIVSARAVRRCGSTTWRRWPAAGAPSAGTPSSSTATTWTRSSMRYAEARATKGRPTMILAKTFKGYGISHRAGQGRLARQGAEGGRGSRSRREGARGHAEAGRGRCHRVAARGDPEADCRGRRPPAAEPVIPPPSYKPGDSVATREAYGTALARLGQADAASSRSTPTWATRPSASASRKSLPERFYENYIAEQVMVGAAMGLAARGAIPFPSTFACFLTRAYDFIRMAAISNLNVKLAGSHAGVSIGEDGPSQMALEDLAMTRAEPNMTVLYPSDAVCARAVRRAGRVSAGPGVHPDEPSEDAGALRHRRGVHRRRIEGAAPVERRRRHRRRRGRHAVRGAEGVRPAASEGHCDSGDRRLLGAADRRGHARGRRARRPRAW